MNCIDVKELLSAYIDGECSQEENDIIKAHLEQCPECFNEYQAIHVLVAKLNDFEEVDVPEGFHDDLMRKIQPLMPSKKFHLPRFTQAYSAVAAIIVVVTLSFIGYQLIPKMSKEESPMYEKSTDSQTYDTASAEYGDEATTAAPEQAPSASEKVNQFTMDMSEEEAPAQATQEAVIEDTTLQESAGANITTTTETADVEVLPEMTVKSSDANISFSEATNAEEDALIVDDTLKDQKQENKTLWPFILIPTALIIVGMAIWQRIKRKR